MPLLQPRFSEFPREVSVLNSHPRARRDFLSPCRLAKMLVEQGKGERAAALYDLLVKDCEELLEAGDLEVYSGSFFSTSALGKASCLRFFRIPPSSVKGRTCNPTTTK